MIIDNLLWTQGKELLYLFALLFLISLFFSRKFILIVLGAFVFTVFFFRNPERVCRRETGQMCLAEDIVCPSDGRVMDVQVSDKNEFDGYARKVSIFLSPLDVHVNWIPIDGVIDQISYKKGKFVPAFKKESGRLNERNDVTIQDAQGRKLKVRQVAGTVARRIVCWVKEGQRVEAGDKFGMIKFSSRVDIFLPADVKVMVKKGQRVYGGKTILGRWLWESQQIF